MDRFDFKIILSKENKLQNGAFRMISFKDIKLSYSGYIYMYELLIMG